MAKYSKDLIDRTIKYFGEKHDYHLDKITAEEYLNSYADLYEAFAGLIENKK